MKPTKAAHLYESAAKNLIYLFSYLKVYLKQHSCPKLRKQEPLSGLIPSVENDEKENPALFFQAGTPPYTVGYFTAKRVLFPFTCYMLLYAQVEIESSPL